MSPWAESGIHASFHVGKAGGLPQQKKWVEDVNEAAPWSGAENFPFPPQ